MKLTMQHLMSEAVQHHRDVSFQNALGGMVGMGTVGKGITPMDIDAIQTTPAESQPSGMEELSKAVSSIQADLNAFRTESRGRGKKKTNKDDKKEPLRCYNCNGENHMARNCMAPKKEKKESGKAGDQ
jgi:hypothetical protein